MNTAKRSDSSLTHIKSKIKVVFLGDQSTGKTCILLRFMYDKFEEGQGVSIYLQRQQWGLISWPRILQYLIIIFVFSSGTQQVKRDLDR
jgi:GTPase SAR1 family protein